MYQKGPFLIPHFPLLLNFSAPVAIIGLCANVSLVTKEVRDFKLLCPQLFSNLELYPQSTGHRKERQITH
jgi:hypothetical protein